MFKVLEKQFEYITEENCLRIPKFNALHKIVRTKHLRKKPSQNRNFNVFTYKKKNSFLQFN